MARLKLDAVVEWRGVEHAPEITRQMSAAERQELVDEVIAVRERAADAHVRLPKLRPNSHRALTAVAWATEVDPHAATELRKLVFRALWHQGLDISDLELINDLACQAGLAVPTPRELADAERLARTWTSEWRAARFNRIPVLISPSGHYLAGLSTMNRMQLFLRSGMIDSNTDSVCVAKV
jgi:predicted DsbA family dithiol-disulfide isomerase